MCGIAGIVGSFHAGSARDRVWDMVRHLERRGPDDEGVESWPAAILGHRRLAIFDLSEAGHQPMVTQDHKVGVVFNGAIYNWPSLHHELSERGHQFQSATDTEVLIEGYLEWGIDGLVRRLRGMFAFGIWDDEDRRLFLVRDRLGQKPLVYSEGDAGIAFASTPTALRAGGLVHRLSESAVGGFLEFGYVPERSCIYEGVKKLPPATILEWHDGRVSSRSYWSLPSRPGRSEGDFGLVVEEAEELLLDAVAIRQFADVPVAALLSGGVDSALVCWALAESGADVAAYTVGVPGHEDDETADAIATAERLGLEHEVIPMDGDLTPDVSELVSAYSEPFACASALGMLAVARAIKPHASVVLTGDGGDDAFLGYGRHNYLWRAQRIAQLLPGPLLSAWRSLGPSKRPIGGNGLSAKALRFMDVIAGGLGAYMSAPSGLPDFELQGWLGDRLRGIEIPERTLPRTNEAARGGLLDFLDLHRREKLVAEYLTKVDGATMYFGLEARSPFLDQEIWEFAAALPPEVRLHGGDLKAVLRVIAQRRLGEEVATGRKRGFSIPVEEWLAGPWRAGLLERLHDSILEREGFVQTGPLLSRLRAHPNNEPLPTHYWYYFVLETWMRMRETSAYPAPIA